MSTGSDLGALDEAEEFCLKTDAVLPGSRPAIEEMDGSGGTSDKSTWCDLSFLIALIVLCYD